jgi:hypothetical protein
MSKHTDGPWEVGEGRTYGHRPTLEYFVRRPGDDVAICSDVLDPDGDNPPSLANAHLIAAAPELLSSLKTAYHIASLSNRDTDEVWAAAKKQILATIAKAEGK